jgi:hypothetical protein
MTSLVMKQDPFHPKCLPVHIALLVELNKTNVLFHLAHRWESLVQIQEDQVPVLGIRSNVRLNTQISSKI